MHHRNSAPASCRCDSEYIRTPFRACSRLRTRSHGIKMPRLGTRWPCRADSDPPPPNNTIVARVEELMKLATRWSRTAWPTSMRGSRPRSSMPWPPASRPTLAELAARRLDLLSTPRGIDALERVVLQLPCWQNAQDEPARALLDRIRAEKERLARSGQRTRARSSRSPKDEAPPFELPQGWEWVSLDEISAQITDGAHHTPTYAASGVPFLSVKNLSSGRMDFPIRFITCGPLRASKRYA
jgi:type I restriction enzyme S subunit